MGLIRRSGRGREEVDHDRCRRPVVGRLATMSHAAAGKHSDLHAHVDDAITYHHQCPKASSRKKREKKIYYHTPAYRGIKERTGSRSRGQFPSASSRKHRAHAAARPARACATRIFGSIRADHPHARKRGKIDIAVLNARNKER